MAALTAIPVALQTNTALNFLDLGDCGLDSRTAIAFGDAMPVNSTLTTLILGGNVFGAEAQTALGEALVQNYGLQTVKLPGSFAAVKNKWQLKARRVHQTAQSEQNSDLGESDEEDAQGTLGPVELSVGMIYEEYKSEESRVQLVLREGKTSSWIDHECLDAVGTSSAIADALAVNEKLTSLE